MAKWNAKLGGWNALVAAALVATPVLAAIPEDKDKVPPPAAASKDAEKAEARAILRDLNELAGSLQKEKGKKGGEPKGLSDAEVLARAGRPTKTVQKSTFDSATIDAILEKAHAAAKVVPAKVTGDEEFIRRVTLDVTGKLPTPEQVIRFRKSTEKNKRAELIDALLVTPDYARNWARYWKDVVQYHATAQNLGLVRFPKMEDWLAEQLEKNRPWDEIATDFITATGNTGENGATVLSAAHQGQAVELAGEVSRVFLGVQIQCAQCHDHPTDAWKREQFHEFAAFFGGIQARNNNAQAANGPSMDIIDRPGRVNYRMPDLKDPTKQIPVSPRFFLASSESPLPANLTASQRRLLAASYITAQDNPWFARAFVNRAWYVLMGDGFYNPVDDLGPTRAAHHVEILNELADAWQKGGYDVRWLFRTILNSKTYQREFRPTTTSAGKTPFAANCPSRLRADQILDALTQALNLQFDNAPAMTPKGQPKPAAANAQKIAAAAARLRGGPRGLFNLTFGVDPSIPNEDVMGTIPQALFLMNSPQIDRAVKANNGTVLANILASNPDERTALESLYLRVLARSPTKDEVRTCDKYLRSAPSHKEGFEDILWALINSTEFLSRK
ncbi:MAG: Protein of unknown function (DUF1553)/Protein of unknown function [Planctomycetota bacterium]|nr:Protein of unknown function (DUF1553)/Protein of unknown function [Planctomycetota bacterium]